MFISFAYFNNIDYQQNKFYCANRIFKNINSMYIKYGMILLFNNIYNFLH